MAQARAQGFVKCIENFVVVFKLSILRLQPVKYVKGVVGSSLPVHSKPGTEEWPRLKIRWAEKISSHFTFPVFCLIWREKNIPKVVACSTLPKKILSLPAPGNPQVSVLCCQRAHKSSFAHMANLVASLLSYSFLNLHSDPNIDQGRFNSNHLKGQNFDFRVVL